MFDENKSEIFWDLNTRIQCKYLFSSRQCFTNIYRYKNVTYMFKICPCIWLRQFWSLLDIEMSMKNVRRSSGGTLWQKRTWLNLIQASIRIYQHRSASISINQHQSASISISQHKSASISILWHQLHWHCLRGKESHFWYQSYQLAETLVALWKEEKKLHRKAWMLKISISGYLQDI